MWELTGMEQVELGVEFVPFQMVVQVLALFISGHDDQNTKLVITTIGYQYLQ